MVLYPCGRCFGCFSVSISSFFRFFFFRLSTKSLLNLSTKSVQGHILKHGYVFYGLSCIRFNSIYSFYFLLLFACSFHSFSVRWFVCLFVRLFILHLSFHSIGHVFIVERVRNSHVAVLSVQMFKDMCVARIQKSTLRMISTTTHSNNICVCVCVWRFSNFKPQMTAFY